MSHHAAAIRSPRSPAQFNAPAQPHAQAKASHAKGHPAVAGRHPAAQPHGKATARAAQQQQRLDNFFKGFFQRAAANNNHPAHAPAPAKSAGGPGKNFIPPALNFAPPPSFAPSVAQGAAAAQDTGAPGILHHSAVAAPSQSDD
jgi:hypothetical protein